MICRILISCCLMATAAVSAHAITVGTVDDFQDLSTNNWESILPNPTPLMNIMDSGPLGTGDHALQVSANGTGSDLVTFNTAQWIGDYLAAGVTNILFDANNIGTNSISLGFEILTSSGPVYTVDTGTIASGSGWQSYSIPLTPLAFGSLSNLSNVTDIRLRWMSGGSFLGGAPAKVLVDNIQAIPEPSTAFLLGLLTMFGFTKRRRVTYC